MLVSPQGPNTRVTLTAERNINRKYSWTVELVIVSSITMKSKCPKILLIDLKRPLVSYKQTAPDES